VLLKGQATGDLQERYGCHKVRKSVEKFLKEEANQKNELQTDIQCQSDIKYFFKFLNQVFKPVMFKFILEINL
jgi:hypothetical protein